MNLYVLSWISVRLITDPPRTWFGLSCVEITRRRTSLLYPSSSTGLRNTKTNWPRLSWLRSPRWTGRQRNDRGQILSYNAVLSLYRLSLNDRALIGINFCICILFYVVGLEMQVQRRMGSALNKYCHIWTTWDKSARTFPVCVHSVSGFLIFVKSFDISHCNIE